MKKPISLFLVSCLITLSSTVISATNAENFANKASINKQIKWLGVSLNSIPPALKSQLAKQIKDNEGVIIQSVEKNSPAKKAGLQAFDILTAFNGKTITNTQQVYNLVQKSSENQTIKLEVVREGVKQAINTKVSVREATNLQSLPFENNRLGKFQGFDHSFWNSQPQWNTPFFQHNWLDFTAPNFITPKLPSLPNNLSGTVKSWSQSLSVKTLKDGKLHAELKTRDKQGNEKNYVYKGKRETIIKQIQQQKELSQNHKDQLLGAVQRNSINLFNQNFFSNNLQPNLPFSNPRKSFPQQNRLVY